MTGQTGQISLYDLLNRFDALGGVERVGQAGFCLWYALIRKSMRLGWAGTFSMTNAELIYTGGFSSEKALWQVRNKLIQMGLIEYEAPPRGKAMAGKYKLNFDFDKVENVAFENETSNQSNQDNLLFQNIEVIPNCFPRENTLETLWESLRKQFGSSLGNINKIRIDKINNNDNDSARIFSEILAHEFNRTLLPAEIKQASSVFYRILFFAKDNALDMLQEAVKRCTSRGIDKLPYLASIVANWEKNKLTSLEEVFAFEQVQKTRGGKQSGKSGGSTRIDDSKQYDISAWEEAGFAVTSGT